MKIVVANHIATTRWVAPLVDRARIIGRRHDVIDLVVLDDVVVSVDQDRLMRRIVDVIVCCPRAEVPPRETLNMRAARGVL